MNKNINGCSKKIAKYLDDEKTNKNVIKVYKKT